MDRIIQKEFKRDILRTKILNLEELLLIITYNIEAILFTEEFSYGFSVIKMVYENIKEEHIILKFIRKNLKNIDQDELDLFLQKLDDQNSQMINYYYDILDGRNIPKDFSLLFETNKFRKEAYSLILRELDMQEFLSYPNTFWSYIKEKITITDDSYFYGVYPKTDKEGIVTDLKVIIPEVINLKTCKIYIHEMKHAYDMYNMLGDKYIEKDYETSARELENEFENKYLLKNIT